MAWSCVNVTEEPSADQVVSDTEAARPTGLPSMEASLSQLANDPLDADELQRIDGWWRAANYLNIGQIYLLANPLLREKLIPTVLDPRRRAEPRQRADPGVGTLTW